jgi:hypothetical protein
MMLIRDARRLGVTARLSITLPIVSLAYRGVLHRARPTTSHLSRFEFRMTFSRISSKD